MAALLLILAVQNAGLEDEVNVLVQRLGSEQISDRERAQVSLQQIGSGGTAILEKHLPHEDPEVDTRVRRALKYLEIERLLPLDLMQDSATKHAVCISPLPPRNGRLPRDHPEARHAVHNEHGIAASCLGRKRPPSAGLQYTTREIMYPLGMIQDTRGGWGPDWFLDLSGKDRTAQFIAGGT